MQLRHWQAPGGSKEMAILSERCDGPQVLVLPAWFDEGNKLRHFTVQVMRQLDTLGIGCVLPDLPGCNESMAPLSAQTLEGWRKAAVEAARQFECSHVLAIRAGANIAPDLPGIAYAPLAGKSALRALLRARVIASKEAGLTESSEELLAFGKAKGLELAGYRFSAAMIEGLAASELPTDGNLRTVPQGDVGGGALWLRMEPDHDQAQANRMARIVAEGVRS